MRNSILLSLLLLMASCGEAATRKEGNAIRFPEEVLLVARVLSTDQLPAMRYPYRIRVQGGMAVLHDLHNDEYYLHAFTYPDMRPIASFGRRGKGEGEMIMAENIRFVSPDSLWVLDSGKGEISRWRILPTEKRAEQVEKIKLDKAIGRALDFDLCNGGFVIPSYMGECRFHTINHKGEIVDHVGDIPYDVKDVKANTPKPALAQAWRSFVHHCPQTQLIVLATQLGEIVEIYHQRDRQTIQGRGGGEPQFGITQGYTVPTGIMGFCDVQITPTRLYALFQGTSMKEIARQAKSGETPEAGGQWIYTFDTEGHPLVKYRLDTPLSGFTINEETGILTGLNVNSNSPIVEFTLPAEHNKQTQVQ